ncbi:MAG: 3-phosphoshikimate 1-carboxyvinyltransferase [Gammaproteobacteria bacterium]
MSDAERIDFISRPVTRVSGKACVPGDKSISHRALMFGAIAEGGTQIQGFLDGADTNATLNAFRQMGVEMDHNSAHEVTVHGAGLRGLAAPPASLDLGNSGTSVRLLAGLLAGQAFDTELVGDPSLMKRPMRRVVEPLRLMGADIECSAAGTLPLHIHGGRKLKGIEYVMPVASAQLKSAILLAGLYADGATSVTEPAVTRDHTERMLEQFGCPVVRDGARIRLTSSPLQGCSIRIPGDISSAAFLMVAACVVPGADILLENIGINPTRDAVIAILRLMGADIHVTELDDGQSEPSADIRVRQQPLSGIRIPEELVPVAIDEFPALFIAAACASGETVLSGAEELRVKESDRIAAMADGLAGLGIDVAAYEDGMRITGGVLRGGEVDSRGDHRIAMAFSVAGAAAQGRVRVRDCRNVDTSFPGFIECINGIGLQVTAETQRA